MFAMSAHTVLSGPASEVGAVVIVNVSASLSALQIPGALVKVRVIVPADLSAAEGL